MPPPTLPLISRGQLGSVARNRINAATTRLNDIGAGAGTNLIGHDPNVPAEPNSLSAALKRALQNDARAGTGDGVMNPALTRAAIEARAAVSFLDYGANPNGTTPCDAAANAALDVSDALFLPTGRYLLTDYNTILRVQAATLSGPGRLLIQFGGGNAERMGRIIRAGVKDASGYQGLVNSGGFVLGGEEGKGTKLYATGGGWNHVEPERLGERLYWQLYSGAYFGLATATPGTGNIVSFYGWYDVADVEVGDLMGFGGKLYKIGAIPAFGTFTLTTPAGAPVTFGSAVSGSWYHSCSYSEGVLSISGTTGTWVSGDLFHPGNHQARLKVDSTTVELAAPAYFTNERQITVPAGLPAGQHIFRLKTVDADLGVTSLVLQGVEGGSETNAYLTLDMLNRLVIARQIAGLGDFGPIVFRTGYDFIDGVNRDHVYIGPTGRINFGGDVHNDGPTNDAKVTTTVKCPTAAATNGNTRANLARWEASFAGANYRYGDAYIPNDFEGLVIQGGNPAGGGSLRLQLEGGAVGIGSAARYPTATLDVGGTFRKRPFVIVTLPDAGAVGDGTEAYVGDLPGGGAPCYVRGAWRRVSDDSTI